METIATEQHISLPSTINRYRVVITYVLQIKYSVIPELSIMSPRQDGFIIDKMVNENLGWANTLYFWWNKWIAKCDPAPLYKHYLFWPVFSSLKVYSISFVTVLYNLRRHQMGKAMRYKWRWILIENSLIHSSHSHYKFLIT